MLKFMLPCLVSMEEYKIREAIGERRFTEEHLGPEDEGELNKLKEFFGNLQLTPEEISKVDEFYFEIDSFARFDRKKKEAALERFHRFVEGFEGTTKATLQKYYEQFNNFKGNSYTQYFKNLARSKEAFDQGSYNMAMKYYLDAAHCKEWRPE